MSIARFNVVIIIKLLIKSMHYNLLITLSILQNVSVYISEGGIVRQTNILTKWQSKNNKKKKICIKT